MTCQDGSVHETAYDCLDALSGIGGAADGSDQRCGARFAVCGPAALRRACEPCRSARPGQRQVTLDRSLDWSGDSTYDLDGPDDLQLMYQTVLNQAATAEDLGRWLDADVLRRTWPVLSLPARLRALWQARFSELAAPSQSVAKSLHHEAAGAVAAASKRNASSAPDGPLSATDRTDSRYVPDHSC